MIRCPDCKVWQCRNHKHLRKYPPDDINMYKCHECAIKCL